MNTELLAPVLSALRSMRRKQWFAVAERADVPIATVEKIAYGHTPNPRVLTVEALARALNETEK